MLLLLLVHLAKKTKFDRNASANTMARQRANILKIMFHFKNDSSAVKGAVFLRRIGNQASKMGRAHSKHRGGAGTVEGQKGAMSWTLNKTR